MEETKTELKYQDLVYFGYDWSDGQGAKSRNLEKEFIADIKKRFTTIKLRDAYDSIKGHRQEVFLPETDEENYLTWIIGNGWHGCSMSVSLMLMSANTEEEKEKIHRLIDLAKKQYPENFKPSNRTDTTT